MSELGCPKKLTGSAHNHSTGPQMACGGFFWFLFVCLGVFVCSPTSVGGKWILMPMVAMWFWHYRVPSNKHTQQQHCKVEGDRKWRQGRGVTTTSRIPLGDGRHSICCCPPCKLFFKNTHAKNLKPGFRKMLQLQEMGHMANEYLTISSGSPQK